MRIQPEAPSDAESEEKGINIFSEHSLHDALKRRAAGAGGRIEVAVGGRIADAVRADGEIVEVQTSGLAAVQEKAKTWAAEGRRIRVQYPIVTSCTIIRIDSRTGEVLSRRKSPKRREFWHAFDELIHAPALIATPGLVFETLMVEVTERREVLPVPVRRGRYPRYYVTIDRSLDGILSSREFTCAEDWLALLPGSASVAGSGDFDAKGAGIGTGAGISASAGIGAGAGIGASAGTLWSSESLGSALGIQTAAARKVLYSLARAGLLENAGVEGRRKWYRRADASRAAARPSAGGAV
ncbi:MAG: hypothetical protein WAX33_04495 [Rectinemataceae bacterium]